MALKSPRVGLARGASTIACAIGAAERALQLACARADSRIAYGKPLSALGGNADVIANARMGIEQARLLALKAAWMMDTVGVKGAMSESPRSRWWHRIWPSR